MISTKTIKLFFLSISFCLANTMVTGQIICPSGDLYILNQADADNFSANYPGCQTISGDLIIGGFFASGTITNLIGLSSIVFVEESIAISDTELTSLNGLHNVTHAGGVGISDNALLTSTAAMNSIANTIFDNGVTFINNPLLTDIDCVSSVVTSNGLVRIIRCDALTDISPLSNLTTAGTTLEIRVNPSLISLSGLENVTTIATHFNISENPLLTSLDGLDGLETVGGNFIIDDNPNISNISAISNLETVGTAVNTNSIFQIINTQISSLSEIANVDLSEVTMLQIYQNPNLSVCEVESICNYLNLPTANGQLVTNATGCNSNAEVEAACAALLPVEIISFKGENIKNQNILNWETANEINNSGFEVEHSTNNRNWSALGFEKANEDYNYSFVDEIPRSGDNYYRLRQIDFDGTEAYSQVISLENRRIGDISIYPNPANDILNIQSTGEITQVTLLSGTGKIYKTLSGSVSRIDISDLPKGVLFVKIKTMSGGNLVQRAVKF